MFLCVRAHVCVSVEAILQLCVYLSACVSFSPDSQEASAASDVAALAAFSPALSFWLTFL